MGLYQQTKYCKPLERCKLRTSFTLLLRYESWNVCNATCLGLPTTSKHIWLKIEREEKRTSMIAGHQYAIFSVKMKKMWIGYRSVRGRLKNSLDSCRSEILWRAFCNESCQYVGCEKLSVLPACVINRAILRKHKLENACGDQNGLSPVDKLHEQYNNLLSSNGTFSDWKRCSGNL